MLLSGDRYMYLSAQIDYFNARINVTNSLPYNSLASSNCVSEIMSYRRIYFKTFLPVFTLFLQTMMSKKVSPP